MSSKPKKWGSFSKKTISNELSSSEVADMMNEDAESLTNEAHIPAGEPKEKKPKYDAKAEIDALKDQLAILNKTLADYWHESANQTSETHLLLKGAFDLFDQLKGYKALNLPGRTTGPRIKAWITEYQHYKETKH